MSYLEHATKEQLVLYCKDVDIQVKETATKQELLDAIAAYRERAYTFECMGFTWDVPRKNFYTKEFKSAIQDVLVDDQKAFDCVQILLGDAGAKALETYCTTDSGEFDLELYAYIAASLIRGDYVKK